MPRIVILSALAAAFILVASATALAGHVDNPAGAQIIAFAPTLTPAATAAVVQISEQSFAVTGLLTSDRVFVNGPAPTPLCPPVTARVSPPTRWRSALPP
jgi:CHASE2 domain-containing sensor protein